MFPCLQKTSGDIEDAVSNEEEVPDKVRGFVKYPRTKVKYRPTEDRLSDWSEVYAHKAVQRTLKTQAARCMDCGVPFCQSSFGCPLGNIIPNWNDLVHKVREPGMQLNVFII